MQDIRALMLIFSVAPPRDGDLSDEFMDTVHLLLEYFRDQQAKSRDVARTHSSSGDSEGML